MEFTLTLSDQTVIRLTDMTYTNKFSTICQTREEVNYLWSKMTPQNTSVCWVKVDGQIIQELTDLKVDGFQVAYNKNGTYAVHFYFYDAKYSKNEDSEWAEAAKILLGEE